MRKFLQKVHVLVLSFVLTISNFVFINQANAGTVGGWSLGNPVAQGASTIYNGAKKVLVNGKELVKNGTAKITPPAGNVAKVLARGVAGYALSVAVQEMLGAVDWVLDPANNQIKYYPEDPTNVPRLWRHTANYNEKYFANPMDACNEYAKTQNAKYVFTSVVANYPEISGVSNGCIGTRTSGGVTSESGWRFGIYSKANPAFDAEAEREEKTIPLTTVAERVISNAEAGNSDAQVATKAAAADVVQEAEKDDVKAAPIVTQLDKSSAYETDGTATGEATQTETKTDPQTGETTTEAKTTDLALEFPTFCGWAPVVCEAAQTVISFPATVGSWVSDLLGVGEAVQENTKTSAQTAEAIKEELTKEKDVPQKDTTDINLPDLPIDPKTVNVNWGASCPQPETMSVSFGGQSKEITILRYDFICEWAWVIKSSVIALASIGAVFIISGRKT